MAQSDLLSMKKEIVARMLRAGVLVNREMLQRLENPLVLEAWHRALLSGVSVVDLVRPEVWIEVVARKGDVVRRWAWNSSKGSV